MTHSTLGKNIVDSMDYIHSMNVEDTKHCSIYERKKENIFYFIFEYSKILLSNHTTL